MKIVIVLILIACGVVAVDDYAVSPYTVEGIVTSRSRSMFGGWYLCVDTGDCVFVPRQVWEYVNEQSRVVLDCEIAPIFGSIECR